MPVGTLREFHPNTDDVEVWIDSFDSYLLANDLDSDGGKEKDATEIKKCQAIFLSAMGIPVLSTLTSLVAPDKPNSKTLQQLKDVLVKHYKPTPKALSERFKFTGCKQKPGETVAQFVAELRRLAQHCKFEASKSMTELEVRIRDQLLFGLSNEKAQNQLFQKDDKLSLADAIQIAEAQESADASTSLIREGQGSHSAEVNKILFKKNKFNQNRHKTDHKAGGGTGECTRCGNKKHSSNDCPHKNDKCNKCKKIGHWAKHCRNKSTGDTSRVGSLTSRGCGLAVGSGEDNYNLATVHSSSSPNVKFDDKIFVDVQLNGTAHRMELDTGCKRSIISEEFWKKLKCPKLVKSDIVYVTYTNERFYPLGLLDCNLTYKGQKVKCQVPVCKGTSLFGRDLLKMIKLDWREVALQCNKILDNGELTLEGLLREFADIFAAPKGRIRNFKAKLVMKDDSSPRFMKARPVPYAIKDKVEAEIKRMVELGHWTRVEHSEWASPLVVVPKANGRVRITGDFKNTVNCQLMVNQYPLTTPEELFNAVSGGDEFSKLDGPDAFHQVDVDEGSKKYLVVNTHMGLFRYNVLPQGIAASPAIFQEVMDMMFKGIPMSGAYLDDGLCSGIGRQDHLENLRKIFLSLRKYNFRLSKEKCEFLQPKLRYLGHVLSQEGLHADPGKVEDILNIPALDSIPEVRAFMGMVNFYGKFVPWLADLANPLYNLLKEQTKWKWDKQCEKSFIKVKSELSSDRLLTHFNPKIPVGIACDASQLGLGVVLFHRFPNGEERPIQFSSRTLSKCERNYSQIEKEGLAIIYGLKKFFRHLYGRKFILVTDHKPLLAIFGPKTNLPPLIATRLQHWALYLNQFQYTIEYRNTKDHGNADCLSRLPSTKGPSSREKEDENRVNQLLEETVDNLPVTAKKIRYQLARDVLLCKVQKFLMSGWPSNVKKEDPVYPYYLRRDQLSMNQGVMMWGARAVIPAKLKVKILNELHSVHAGIVRMKSLARQYIWWPGIDEDIERVGKACLTCSSNQPNPPNAPLHPWEYPEAPWQRIHCDLAGPFLGKMWLIIVDAYSKWPEIHCMGNDTTSAQIIVVLRRVFSAFGIPVQTVTDNGRQFTSKELENFLKSKGIRHSTSSVYHPRSNGEAERMVQTFKNAMKKGEGDLEARLQEFLSIYRLTPHATTGVAPCELMMGRRNRNIFDLIIPDVKDNVKKSQEKQCQNFDKNTKQRQFHDGQDVWVKTFKKDEKKWSLGKIIKAIGPLTFMVEVNGEEMKRHSDQIIQATAPVQSQQEIATQSEEEENFPPSTPEAEEEQQEEVPETPEVEDQTEPETDQSVCEGERESVRRNPSRQKKPIERLGYARKGGF